VVRADDLEPGALQEGDATEHLLAEHGVRLHQRPLLRAQRSGLLEDVVRDPDLADVVEEEAVFGAGVFHELAPERAGELDGVVLDALRVNGCPAVLGLERRRERGHRLSVALREQQALAALDLEEVPEIARVELELLGHALGARSAERDGVQPACQPLHDRQELERAERLADERVRSRCSGGLGGAAVRAGQEDDRDAARGRIGLQVVAEVEAASARHAHVENDDIGAMPPDGLRRGRRVVGLFQVDIDCLERRPQ
jgi:hypothetical protein